MKRRNLLLTKTPLRSKTGLRSAKGLRFRSRKTENVYVQRRKIVAEMLDGAYCCFPNCTSKADDVHELLSRGRGGSIVDRDNLVVLCRTHHRWVTDHPKQAEEMGLLKSSRESG